MLSSYPAGHLGHLSPEQSQAFDDFKDLCSKNGYQPDASRIGLDDATLLRFLRARKFVPEDAFRQFKSTMEWREEQDIEQLYDTIDLEEYEKTRLLYTQWTGRRDKRGIPLYVFNIGAVDQEAMAAQDTSASTLQPRNGVSPKLRRLFATYEHLLDFVMPLCSAVPCCPYPETPISQTCNIVDISGVGIRQFWGLRNHLQSAGALANANYPETLGLTLVVGAPSFFPTVWNSIKRWFDPITVAKVFILSASEVKEVLEQHIAPENIPKRYGGELDWDFGQMPNLDPKILEIMQMQDGKTEIPKGPIRWVESKDKKTMEARALGTCSGVRRSETIAHVDSATFAQSSR